MLPDEPLDAALADAVSLGQFPLRRAPGEGRDELFRVGRRGPHPSSAGSRDRTHAERRFGGPRLCLLELLYRSDQRVCQVRAF